MVFKARSSSVLVDVATVCGISAHKFLPKSAITNDIEGIALFRGSGEDGQLGLGDYGDENRPRAVDALADVNVVSLVAGSRNSLAIDEGGGVSFIYTPVGCS